MISGSSLVLWMQRAGAVMMLLMMLSGRFAVLRAHSRRWLWVFLALYVAVWMGIVVWRFVAGPEPFME
jgi:hypothetical protein